MVRATFIKILKTFSGSDMNEFGLFIQAAFFNTNKSVIKLYEQVKKLHPDFEDAKLQKKMLFAKAFGKIKYSESHMAMTIFRLQELAKEFLIQKNLRRNDLISEISLLDELNNKELNDLMMKFAHKLDQKTRKLKVSDAEVYFAKYKLEYFKNEAKAKDTKTITYKDLLDKNLMLEQKNLNTFFFLSSLKFFDYFLNQKDFVINTEGYPELLNYIMEYLKQHPEYLAVPVLKVYYLLVLLLISLDDSIFYELKKMLFEDKNNIGYSEKYNIITVLRNYAVRKCNEGDNKFLQHEFELTRFSIKKNILTYLPGANYISETRFMNAVWSAIKANELEWAEEFIQKYLKKVEPDKRQYVFAYNTARLEFERANYQQALEKLSKSGAIKNVFYKAAIKQLTLMIYYELRWFVAAAELLDSYKHFVKSNKLLPEMYKTQCTFFIINYNRILKFAESTTVNNDFEIDELIAELKLNAQTWLSKKAEELKREIQVK